MASSAPSSSLGAARPARPGRCAPRDGEGVVARWQPVAKLLLPLAELGMLFRALALRLRADLELAPLARTALGARLTLSFQEPLLRLAGELLEQGRHADAGAEFHGLAG